MTRCFWLLNFLSCSDFFSNFSGLAGASSVATVFFYDRCRSSFNFGASVFVTGHWSQQELRLLGVGLVSSFLRWPGGDYDSPGGLDSRSRPCCSSTLHQRQQLAHMKGKADQLAAAPIAYLRIEKRCLFFLVSLNNLLIYCFGSVFTNWFHCIIWI